MSVKEYQVLGQIIKDANIQHLSLSHIDFEKMSPDIWLQTFFQAIKDSKLQSLDLSCNKLGKLDAEPWQTFSQTNKNSKLQSLNLHGNELGTLSPEKWEAFCHAIMDSELHSLDLSDNDLEKLKAEQWKILGQAINVSKLHSLDLSWNELGTMDAEPWQAFCQMINASKLKSLKYYGELELGLNAEQWHDFFNAIEDNFNLHLEISSEHITQEIGGYITRNAKIKSACQRAERALKKTVSDVETLSVISDLSSAISLLEGKFTKNAIDTRESLLALQAKLMSHIFEYQYVSSLADDPALAEKRHAFVDALSFCLNAENHFVKFDDQNQKVFDKILMAAAGIEGSFLEEITKEQRASLLKYVILSYIRKSIGETKAITSASSPIFSRSKKLPKIKSLQDLDQHRQEINDTWQEAIQRSSSLPDKIQNIASAIATLVLKETEYAAIPTL
jgi:hypothetical protein